MYNVIKQLLKTNSSKIRYDNANTRQLQLNSNQLLSMQLTISFVIIKFHKYLPVEFVDAQSDLWFIWLATALAAIDLFNASDTEWLRCIQIGSLNVVRGLPVVFWIKVLIHIIFPVRTFHWACSFHPGIKINRFWSKVTTGPGTNSGKQMTGAKDVNTCSCPGS